MIKAPGRALFFSQNLLSPPTYRERGHIVFDGVPVGIEVGVTLWVLNVL